MDKDEQKAIYETIQKELFQKNQEDSGAQIDFTTPPRQHVDAAGDDFDWEGVLARHCDPEDDLDRKQAEEARE